MSKATSRITSWAATVAARATAIVDFLNPRNSKKPVVTRRAESPGGHRDLRPSGSAPRRDAQAPTAATRVHWSAGWQARLRLHLAGMAFPLSARWLQHQLARTYRPNVGPGEPLAPRTGTGAGTTAEHQLHFPTAASTRPARSQNEGAPASIAERIQSASGATRGTGHPTKTALDQYQIGSDELALQIPKLKKLLDTDIKKSHSNSTPPARRQPQARLPDWKGGK